MQFNSLHIKFIGIFTVITISLLVSCNSPLEVPANRDIKYKENPFGNPVILMTPNYTSLDFVHLDSVANFEIKIENNQDNTYPITDYHFFWNNSNFKIINKAFPIILSPKGTENSSTIVQVIFSAKSFGAFNDTLVVNNLAYPHAIVEAKVPYIYVNELNISDLKANEKYSGKLLVKNHSSNPAILKSISFAQYSNLFTILEQFPFEIPRNSQTEIHFEFSSQVEGLYNTKITLDIESLTLKSLIDNTSLINISVDK